MTLFPMFETSAAEEDAYLPLYRDAAWDYERDAPVFSGGAAAVASGLEAVKSWVWRAIKTARYQFPIFSWDYGCELDALVGQPYQEDTKLQEARRYIQEALTVNPYITAAEVTEIALEGSQVRLCVEVDTVYGKETIHV